MFPGLHLHPLFPGLGLAYPPVSIQTPRWGKQGNGCICIQVKDFLQYPHLLLSSLFLPLFPPFSSSSSFFTFFLLLYCWLQCCVSFSYTAKWFGCTYTSVYSFSHSFPFSFSLWVAQSCPTLCNPVNHSLPGSPAHRIITFSLIRMVKYWVQFPVLYCRSSLVIYISYSVYTIISFKMEFSYDGQNLVRETDLKFLLWVMFITLISELQHFRFVTTAIKIIIAWAAGTLRVNLASRRGTRSSLMTQLVNCHGSELPSDPCSS